MKSVPFRKQIMSIFLSLSLSLLMGNLYAADISTDTLNDDCSKEFLMSFFPDRLVKETLERHKVPKDQWDGIVKDLNAKDKEIIQLVEEKAAKIDPQLLKDPERRKDAVKIFRETLFNAFSSVMKAHGVNDPQQIKDMLEEVQKQKAKKFAECIQKEEQQQQAQSQQQSQQQQTQQPATKIAPQPVYK